MPSAARRRRCLPSDLRRAIFRHYHGASASRRRCRSARSADDAPLRCRRGTALISICGSVGDYSSVAALRQPRSGRPAIASAYAPPDCAAPAAIRRERRRMPPRNAASFFRRCAPLRRRHAAMRRRRHAACRAAPLCHDLPRHLQPPCRARRHAHAVVILCRSVQRRAARGASKSARAMRRAASAALRAVSAAVTRRRAR